MRTDIPSPEQVREALQGLTMKQIKHLADLSSVGWGTIYKIQRGETEDPGINTVGKLLPHLKTVRAAKAV